MLRLAVRIAHAAHVSKEILRSSLSHLPGGRVVGEELRSDEVDPLVGTLSREDYRYQQAEGVVIVQLCVGIGVVLCQML